MGQTQNQEIVLSDLTIMIIALVLSGLLLFGTIGWIIWSLVTQKKRRASEPIADGPVEDIHLQRVDKPVVNEYLRMKGQLTILGVLIIVLQFWVAFRSLSSPGWSLLLLVVALMTLNFKEPEMFAFLGTLLGVNSFLSAITLLGIPPDARGTSSRWIIIVAEFVGSVLLYREYFRYSKIMIEYAEQSEESLPSRVRNIFPKWSLICGVASFMFFVYVAVPELLRESPRVFYAEDPRVTIAAFDFSLTFAKLAIGMSVTSLLSKLPRKMLWLIGGISGTAVRVLSMVLFWQYFAA
jgi:hypothetical protein